METQTEILICLFACHWLADYTHLSTAWMLNAKRFGTPILPIFAHAAVHATLMSAVLCWFIGVNQTLFALAAIQLLTHFIIDVWKGRMNGWFPLLQSPANKWHWVVFGLDQYLHALVIIAMLAYISK